MLKDIERTLAAVDPARAIDLGAVSDRDAQALLREVLAQPGHSRPRRRRGSPRRLTMFALAGLAVAFVVAASMIAGNSGNAGEATDGSPRAQGDHAGASSAAHHPRDARPDHGTRVRLVAYTGEQLPGFVVHQIPEGWYLQGANAFRLTLAPRGDTSSPDAFVGKLVVMLLSSDAPQKLPNGDPVRVGAYDGVLTHADQADPDGADTLTYRDDAGHFVQIEAWLHTLGWTDRQLVSFGENVRVTAQAQPGVG